MKPERGDAPAPPDAEARRRVAPVVCYPTGSLRQPDLAAYRAAREGWRKVDEVVVPPRDAFLADSESVDVDDAIGRVSAETIAGYPPGIPALLPGERITGEVIEYLRELTGAGARLHGASDPSFRTVFVLRD